MKDISQCLQCLCLVLGTGRKPAASILLQTERQLKVSASRHLLAATGLAMARVSATLDCAPQKIEPQQPARRRQQPQQLQQPAVISDAAVEAAEQMARLLLQARQEVLFICCRVAVSCGC